GPYREPVRLDTDLDDLRLARGRVERVDDVVIAAGEPKGLAVRAHIAHVGASATRDGPGRIDLLGGEIDYGDAPRAALRSVHLVRAAVGDIQLLPVAARIESMRAFAGRDESHFLEGLEVDDEDAVGHHVGDIEALAVG